MTDEPAGASAPGCESVFDARRHLFAAIEDALLRVGRARFGQRRLAYRLRRRLDHWSGSPVCLTESTDQLAFEYDPFRGEVAELRYGGETFDLEEPGGGTVALLADYPSAFDGIADAIADLRADVDDGPRPGTTEIREAKRGFAEAIADVRATATLDDLVDAIRNRNEELVEVVLDVDDPIASQAGTELAALFDHAAATVVYRDDELALLLPEFTIELSWRGGWAVPTMRPREAYVVGRDDTPTRFFVHAVDGTNLTPTARVTRADVRRAMGFDRDLPPDAERLDLGEGERVRIQGDLCLERRGDDGAMRDRLAAHLRPDAERAVTEEFFDRFLRARGLDAHRDRIRLSGRGTDIDVDVPKNRFGGETVEAIERLFVYHGGDGSLRPSMRPDRYGRAARRLERRATNYLAGRAPEYADAVERRVTHRLRDVLADCGQLNLPIDNHLAILGTARLHPAEDGDREPVRVVVPDETSLHVVHDEHPQVDLRLGPGEYEFRLLDRGLQPASERPEW